MAIETGKSTASPRLRVLAYKPAPARQTIAMQHIMCSEPLELEYLAAYLDDHDVTLIDGMVDSRDPVSLALELGVDAVLITAFITNIDSIFLLAEKLKRLPYPPLVFVGGPHAEVCPEHFSHPAIDAVFFANQLEAVAEVMSKYANAQVFDDVKGVAFWRHGLLTRNPSPPLNPNQLRRPKRELFDTHQERYFYFHHQRCASIKTAFGCHENCAFCFCTRMHAGRYAPRPLDDVVTEISEINSDCVFIVDDNFLSSEKRCLDFAQRCRGMGKKFIAYGDAAFATRHPHVLEALRDAGLVALIVGFEFIDNHALKTVNKRTSVDDNDRCVALCRQLGIELNALFIVDPAWSPSAFARLAEYVRSRSIPFAAFSTLTSFPGSAIAPKILNNSQQQWWRYDLLRLHQEPRYFSRFGYYWRLLLLYMVPSLNRESRQQLHRFVGTLPLLSLSLRAMLTGAEFALKLLRWR